jgi:hypothetical protein
MLSNSSSAPRSLIRPCFCLLWQPAFFPTRRPPHSAEPPLNLLCGKNPFETPNPMLCASGLLPELLLPPSARLAAASSRVLPRRQHATVRTPGHFFSPLCTVETPLADPLWVLDSQSGWVGGIFRFADANTTGTATGSRLGPTGASQRLARFPPRRRGASFFLPATCSEPQKIILILKIVFCYIPRAGAN